MIKCAIGETQVGGMYLNSVRIGGLALGDQILYQELVKIATGTTINIMDSKKDVAIITGVKGTSTQETSTRGKNLFNANMLDSITNNTTYYIINRNTFTATTNTATAWQWITFMVVGLAYNTNYFIKIPRYNSSVSVTNNYCLIKASDKTTNLAQGYLGTAGIGFNSGNNGVIYVRINITNDIAVINTLSVSEIQLEQGTAATSFEATTDNKPSAEIPSTILSTATSGSFNVDVSDGANTNSFTINTTKPIRSLPNGIVDTISENGTLTQNIDTLVINGSETYTLWDNKTATIAFYMIPAIAKTGITDTSVNCYCNKFIGKSRDNTLAADYECVGVANSGVFVIRVLKSRLTTVDHLGFKAWLALNNITITFQKPTVVTSSVVVPDMLTLGEETTITSSDNVKPEITLKYISK